MTPLDQRLDAPAYGEAPRPLETLAFTVEAICNGKGAPRLCRRARPPTRHRGEAAAATRVVPACRVRAGLGALCPVGCGYLPRQSCPSSRESFTRAPEELDAAG